MDHRIVIFGHSYVRRFGLYCRSRGIANFGFPDWYFIQLIGLSGAKVDAFEAWALHISALLPELIIVDLGGNDLTDPSINITERSAELLLHLQKIMDRIPSYIQPRVVILEQHHRSRVAGLDTNYVACNRRLNMWHSCITALPRVDYRFGFQRLLGLNGPHWFRELMDGIHLSPDALHDYLRTIQFVIRSFYHLA